MLEKNNIHDALNTQSKYCYPDTDVLVNSQGIRD